MAVDHSYKLSQEKLFPTLSTLVRLFGGQGGVGCTVLFGLVGFLIQEEARHILKVSVGLSVCLRVLRDITPYLCVCVCVGESSVESSSFLSYPIVFRIPSLSITISIKFPRQKSESSVVSFSHPSPECIPWTTHGSF